MKMVFTTGEAADICKISQQTIIRCFDAGRCKGFRVPGSRFRRIPREALLTFMREHGIPQDALQNGKRKVLFISSDRQFITPLIKSLPADRYDVRIVAGGFDAGVAVREFLPDLAVVDLTSVNSESAAMCRSIRQNASLQQVRILAVRGHSFDEADHVLKAGCHAHVAEATAENLQSHVAQMLA